MKHLKYLLGLALLWSVPTFAQTDQETTTRIIENKTFNFVANSALPMSSYEVNKVLSSLPGNQSSTLIQLSGSQYDVHITPDSVIAFLPYYGRSFSAPYNPSEGGIKFTTKKFGYQKSKNKKGNYTIQIDTKDLSRENYRFVINVSKNGYATLTANSVNKQPIVFNGYIEEPKKKSE